MDDGSPVMTLTRDMPIQVNADLELRTRRGERLVLVRRLPVTMFVDAHEGQCQRNHSQTLERIRERHGFGAIEAVAVLSCVHWDQVETMKSELAHRILYAMVSTHNRGMRVADAASPSQDTP